MEGKLDCTSANEKDIVFDAFQKRYRRGCVRYYCQKLCNVINLRSFNFVSSLVKLTRKNFLWRV